jgi:hypothetical protein
LAGDGRRSLRQLEGPLLDAVVGQDPGQRTEAVGLHHVAADVEKGAVQIGDHVRPGGAQQLVAALQGMTTEVIRTQFAQLQVGSRGAIEDHDPLA